MINVNYTISQILALLSFIISLIAFHRDKKEKILSNMILSNILNLIHYLLLGAFSGVLTKIIAILRDYIIINKKNKKILNSKYTLIILIVLYIFAAIFSYNNIYSLFPIIAALIYIVSIWNGNALRTKKTAFFCEFLWLGYNIFVFSIVGIFSKIIAIISTYIAIKNYSKSLKE